MGKLEEVGELVGFVHRYGTDDYSIWAVELSDADRDAINSILEKYQNDGVSIRGNSQMTLSEAF